MIHKILKGIEGGGHPPDRMQPWQIMENSLS